ncbi:MAG TPA: type II secretion system F family protein [Candidatus Thiothrix moscowensis]|uniref:type II secretion system F family protein n=1 Tax=unclassified Thiothrix TaxID=2636184 RepID=UPI0025E73FA2|nr:MULTISPECIES: type II secretion system F family protein [unclassified Thiothrix]HRJ51620.1 type II secretion system F family protein [Candidatus Thiothrix moscowensis]HRJ91935.1 type II secretion system F family protein [Candidatus Thiothrix moscowensis]
MPAYSYKAITPQGVPKEGMLEAASETLAAESLNAQGLIPIRILASKNAAAAGKPATGKRSAGLFGSKKISQHDIMALTQQLATMLKAGLPLDRALGILLEISDKAPVIELVQAIQGSVRSGKRFADALEDSGKFSRFYINMVRAGEAGGSIDDALARLVEYMARAKELRGTVISALIYPAILAFVAVVSIIALLTFVVPQFAQMFKDMGGDLPTITKVVMGTADTLQHYWWAVLGGFLLVLLLVQYILTNEKARTGLDRSLLRWPIVGDLIGKVEMARFSRSLGTLLHNGVPLLGALKIARNTVSNRVMAAAVDESADSLKQGESLTRTLLGKGVFPPYALHMLRVGEETGRMEELLREVADIYDDEVKTSVKQMLALLEPMLILVMAVAILVIIGSVLLPMINMADLVK